MIAHRSTAWLAPWQLAARPFPRPQALQLNYADYGRLPASATALHRNPHSLRPPFPRPAARKPHSLHPPFPPPASTAALHRKPHRLRQPLPPAASPTAGPQSLRPPGRTDR